MALKIFFDGISQPSRSVLIFLRCANIKHTPVLTNIAKGDNRAAEFLKINPTGRVPFMDDDGFQLFESAAIMKYICETRSVEDHWYPKEVKARAKIDEYLAWHHTNLRMGAAMTFRKSTLVPLATGKPVNMEDVKKYAKLFQASMKLFESHFLAETDFISSNQISIADLLAFTELTQLELVDEKIIQIPDKVEDWLKRCVSATEPHCSDVHTTLKKLKMKFLASKM